MKKIIKPLVALFFIPTLLLAMIIAALRILFALTFVFAWEKSADWYGEMLGKVNDFMQSIKTQKP